MMHPQQHPPNTTQASSVGVAPPDFAGASLLEVGSHASFHYVIAVLPRRPISRRRRLCSIAGHTYFAASGARARERGRGNNTYGVS